LAELGNDIIGGSGIYDASRFLATSIQCYEMVFRHKREKIAEICSRLVL